MTTGQVLSFLMQYPDSVVELKSLLADLARQQGTNILADEITDEMLYASIASNAELRAEIATFLRARGYRVAPGFAPSQAPPHSENALRSPGISRHDECRDSESQSVPELMPGMPWNGSKRDTLGFPPQDAPQTNGIRTSEEPSANEEARDAAAEPQVLHRPTPANLQSLRDLYAQLPEPASQLKRFGSDVFLRRSESATNQLLPNSQQALFDIPAGPSYVVGPGDSLAIDLWGGISQTLVRVVDREGRLALPDSGPLQVAGMSLERVQAVVADTLRHQFRDVKVAVTIARLRAIRVYVVGDVQRPGAYDISSLSTSLNALYAAGGPTAVGSLRTLRHYRGQKLIGEIDLYDFLLHGVQNEDRLEAGDTVLVPPAGAQVAISGAVKRPAIYEMKAAGTMASVLSDAGGVTVAAALGHIEIDRIDVNHQRETVSLDLPEHREAPTAAEIAAFPVFDGDRIRVAPILPYSQRVVYLEGHVARPGRVSYNNGMRLSDVLRSYRDLLPEPADNGEIVRLSGPDLHPEIVAFSLPDVLIGNENPTLAPFDTIRIYGRYEVDAPRVTVGGEVLRPGSYALSAGMTAAQLVRMAGGFKRDALLDNADLTSYNTENGVRVVSQRSSVRIGDAVMNRDSRTDVPLKPGDVLTVHQIAGWKDIGSSITIEGEVAHPGSYGIQQGERLSSILRRAGGFRETGYPAGAVLLREEVRRLEEKSRQELIRQIETSSAAAQLSPSLGNTDPSATLQLIAQQQQQVVARLRSQPAIGRLVIHIDNNIASWENSDADIELRAGDVLRIPKRPAFVLVSGQVYNSTAITFAPDKSAAWYLRRAGGPTEIANKGAIFIIRANGSVVGRGSGAWLDRDVLATKLDPGDVVVVPQKILGASALWRNLLTVAQIASSIAITAAVAGVI